MLKLDSGAHFAKRLGDSGAPRRPKTAVAQAGLGDRGGSGAGPDQRAETVIPVILSGGAGTRLWPESLPEKPKQLLALTGERTMLQLTLDRILSEDFAPPIIVASERHADMVEEQLAQSGAAAQALLLEPMARSTAPAIALAAIAAGGGATPLLVMPADHLIEDLAAFHAAIRVGLPLVAEGWLCTFGITANAPETGYGWIQVAEALSPGVHRVGRFVEKPPRDKAEAMLASGDHVWNSGIFMFRADSFLRALADHAPAILEAAEAAMAKATEAGARIRPDAEAFAASPSRSVDYSVMEQAQKVAVVPVSMGWSDIGSWDALHALSPGDADDNVCRGDVIAIEASNCLVRAAAGKRVALLGVSDLIVVTSGDNVLILPRGRSQEIRTIMDALERGDQ